MFILDSSCGWIPDPPIKFAYHLINLIKNLTPVILIIMGSLDFGKAVMAHKDDEIKKAQNAFIKKLIAGAAVFFVIVFAKWVVKILINAGVADGNQALNCVNRLLNDTYTPDDKKYYEAPPTTTKTTTKTTTDYSYNQVIKDCLEDEKNLKFYNECKSNLIVKNDDGTINVEETQNKLNPDKSFMVNLQEAINNCTTAVIKCNEYMNCMDEQAIKNGVDFMVDDNGLNDNNYCKNLTYVPTIDKDNKCKKEYDEYNNANKNFSGNYPGQDYTETKITDKLTEYCKNLYNHFLSADEIEKTVDEVCKAQVCPN